LEDILSVLFSRRSIRRYLEKPVERDLLIKLLQAGMAAPSAANSQPWEFIVVDDPGCLEALKMVLAFGKYNAPAAIVVCGNPQIANNSAGERFWVQDCTAALENMLIAAAGLGLGSVWIGVYPMPAVIAAVKKALNIPDAVTPLAVVYFGYPDEQKSPGTKFNENRIHWQAYEPKKPRLKVKKAWLK
jgi:nitroreductase